MVLKISVHKKVEICLLGTPPKWQGSQLRMLIVCLCHFLYTVYSWFLSHFVIKFLIFLWKWVFCLHVYLCTTSMLVPSRGQKGASEHLEIELQMIVTHLVSSGNRTVAL